MNCREFRFECEELGGACNHSNSSILNDSYSKVSRRLIAATRRQELPTGLLNISLHIMRFDQLNRNFRFVDSTGYVLRISYHSPSMQLAMQE